MERDISLIGFFMDFDKVAQLTPLLSAGAIKKPRLYALVFSFNPISSPSFSNLLFEWRALELLTFEKEKHEFTLNKTVFLKHLNESRRAYGWELAYAHVRPEWWKKWGPILKEQLH